MTDVFRSAPAGGDADNVAFTEGGAGIGDKVGCAGGEVLRLVSTFSHNIT